jgi:hypothetical protein
MTVDLINDIISKFEYEDLVMCYSKPWMLSPTISQILTLLAITIRIRGLRPVPQKNTKNMRPKRKAVEEAIEHFRGRYPLSPVPGIDMIEKLLSIPLVTSAHCEILSRNFQNLVFHLGESCAGDEKLFYFTGKSHDIRLVPHKPGRIGLWFYELCAPLRYGGQYLLFTKLHKNNEYTSVSSIVEIWSNIIKALQCDQTLLTMDSYYLDNSAKLVLEQSGIKYVAAFTANKFQSITNEIKKKVNNPGDWYGIHNSTNLNSIVYHWSPETTVGKKWVMTNSAPKTRSRTIGNLVPVFHLYKMTFSCCDRFNKSLNGTTWPFKKGGNNKYGGLGAEYDFLFTCILHNTFNCFFDRMNRPSSEIDFRQCCLDLADELFEYASNMNN